MFGAVQEVLSVFTTAAEHSRRLLLWTDGPNAEDAAGRRLTKELIIYI